MSVAPPASELAARLEDDLRDATRALLADHILGSEHPAFRTVALHEGELARRFNELWGYRLEVAPTFARLFKRPTEAALRRPLRIRPGTRTGAARPRDQWPTLDRRRGVFLMLTAAALERAHPQLLMGELVTAVTEAAGACDPPIAVDFRQRPERVALADVLDLLCHWGVIDLTDGDRSNFAQLGGGSDEALFTVDRKRLAGLIRDPMGAAGAATVDDLADDRGDYLPTQEGQNLRVRHRLARQLTEDPVLYIDRLTEEERAYFRNQRAYLETRVSQYAGMEPERRAEGTAMVEAGRELTDVAFPAGSAIKQVALLLCQQLAQAYRQGRDLTVDQLEATVRGLVARHGESWNRSAEDPVEVEETLNDALEVLADLDLIEPLEGAVRPLALCARFRAPAVNATWRS